MHVENNAIRKILLLLVPHSCARHGGGLRTLSKRAVFEGFCTLHATRESFKTGAFLRIEISSGLRLFSQC